MEPFERQAGCRQGECLFICCENNKTLLTRWRLSLPPPCTSHCSRLIPRIGRCPSATRIGQASTSTSTAPLTLVSSSSSRPPKTRPVSSPSPRYLSAIFCWWIRWESDKLLTFSPDRSGSLDTQRCVFFLLSSLPVSQALIPPCLSFP